MATAILFPEDVSKEKNNVNQTGGQWFEKRFTETVGKLKTCCAICNRDMWFPKSKSGKYKTCGAECAEKLRLTAKISRAKECITCGKEFFPRATQIRDGHGKYCSQACNKSHEAMNTPTAQAKARLSWSATFAKNPFAKKGTESPRWNGGKEAVKVRNSARASAYKKANPDKVRVWSANRRKKEGDRLPSSKVKALFALQRGSCAVCSKKLASNFHLDHINPIAKGGDNNPRNFQLLCRSCNLHKAAKDPVDFMQSQGFLL